MTLRRLATGVLLAATAVGFGWSLFATLERWLETPPAAPAATDGGAPATAGPTPAADATAVPRIRVTLFATSPDGVGLTGFDAEVPLGESPAAQARAILEAQLRAMPSPPLASPIPEGVVLRGVYLSERQDLFADFDASLRERHPGGSRQELCTVYAIVNAVTVNLPAVRGVQILIDGREVDTLAGHVDLRRPLAPNDAIIRE